MNKIIEYHFVIVKFIPYRGTVVFLENSIISQSQNILVIMKTYNGVGLVVEKEDVASYI
mgnify:CR=1 FL=1